MRDTHGRGTIAATAAMSCLAALAVVAGLLLGDGRDRPRAAAAAAPLDERTVTFDGVDGITFGTAKADLVARHGLSPQQGCNQPFADVAGAGPVFRDGKLVLLWAHAPLHTPEGIAEGSAVGAVRTAYANEVELSPPAGSHTYPGILVENGDRAFLFLHDGQTVKKEVAGYAVDVRRLFETGFGAC
ncbi:hypothetical protein [Hamadaea tsunoensis]|uniref:hypothetical protein n=1 Tax=Hamadaea tsunoensis TaxID=53368 RepID=UPI0004056E15|nr:hypothetical protein [Hamadaea tsunoensis]